MQGFRYDAHPMGMLMASVGALSTFYPDARNISDADNRHMQIVRMIAKMPTLGAWSFRHAQGKPYVYPDNDLGYTANFLSMLFKMSESKFEADERLVKALDVLFILHADHEQNCSTNAVRSVGSSQVDPYSAVVGRRRRALRPAARRRQRGRAADAQAHRQQGEHPRLHRGREERQRAPDGLRPPGLQELRPARQDHQEGLRRRLRGHRDQPAARHRARSWRRSRSRTSTSSSASSTPTWTSTRASSTRPSSSRRRCSPCCSPSAARPGWLAQWSELVQDKDQKIARPKQIYTGDRELTFTPASERWS